MSDTAARPKIPVIFDTDPGVDDTLALLMLARHRDVDLVGMTTVFGNASVEDTTRNALYLCDRFAIGTPVAAGAGAPLQRAGRGEYPVTIHGHNGLGDVAVPDTATRHADPRPAHRFLIDELRRRPGEITVVAVGPLTNLALALREDPGIAGLARSVVIMGGAFGTHGFGGNITPAAEANIYNDPEAADVVLTAPWPVTLVGLDVTKMTVLTGAMLETIRDRGGEMGRFIWDVTRVYHDFHRGFGVDGLYMHDPAAVAYMLAPELFEVRRGSIRILTESIAVGQTVQKPDDAHHPPGAWHGHPSQQAAIGVDADAVLDLLVKTCFGAL